uniref:BPL_C domain-containing protein n=1 Tax=Heterorhabditis bacteriophora TaxID=37862 RepID=A0A1I7XDC4_HETBA
MKSKVEIFKALIPHLRKVGPETLSVLIDNLPGYPDNLRLSNSGMIWVPLAALRSEEDNWIAERPWLREILTKTFSPQALQFIVNWLLNKYGIVLKINPTTGEVIESLHDAVGRVSDISIAVEDGRGNLLLGSDVNYYIARVKL